MSEPATVIPVETTADGNGSAVLRLTNDLAELARVTTWIEKLPEQYQLTAAAAFRLDLVAEEAITNIVSYACQDAGSGPITARLACRDSQVVLELEDEGQPFNPLMAPDFAPAEDLESAPIGGLGIHFIRQYTRDCEYRREHGKNIFTMHLDI